MTGVEDNDGTKHPKMKNKEQKPRWQRFANAFISFCMHDLRSNRKEKKKRNER